MGGNIHLPSSAKLGALRGAARVGEAVLVPMFFFLGVLCSD